MPSKPQKRTAEPAICNGNWNLCSSAKTRARARTPHQFRRRSCGLPLQSIDQRLQTHMRKPNCMMRQLLVAAIAAAVILNAPDADSGEGSPAIICVKEEGKLPGPYVSTEQTIRQN